MTVSRHPSIVFLYLTICATCIVRQTTSRSFNIFRYGMNFTDELAATTKPAFWYLTTKRPTPGSYHYLTLTPYRKTTRTPTQSGEESIEDVYEITGDPITDGEVTGVEITGYEIGNEVEKKVGRITGTTPISRIVFKASVGNPFKGSYE